MKIKQIIDALERFAPLPLQESYDNAGLQVGLTETEASGALLCLDVTEEVVREAIDMDCNLIVAHHPLLFRGLKKVGDDTQVERVVRMAIKNDIAIYAAHTNLDNAEDGVNYKIAEKLGLVDVQMINPRRVTVRNGLHERTVMAGSGVMGYFPAPLDSLIFLEKVKNVFGVEGCEASINAIHDFYRGLGIPMTLKEVGIDDSRLGEMAKHVAELEGLDKAWAPLHENDILDIFKACL